MFVFDLFERDNKKTASDRPQSRFVSGYSQNADAKAALDTAMRVAPDASSPEEALAALANQQMELNKQQSAALDQQTNTNQQQAQQIQDLVSDQRRKEKDFRDLNAQIANMPNVTAQQAAKMAQDIEAAHDKDNKEPVSVPDVVAKRTQQPAAQPATAVAKPGPGASITQIAQYQQAKDQGAKTATPQPTKPAPTATAKPAATTSPALGQMATQLTGEPPALRALPSQVVKGKSTWAANQPTIEPKPTTGTGKVKTFINPADAQTIQSILSGGQAVNNESVTEAQLKWAVPQGRSAEEISKANLSNIVLGALAPDHPPVKMYFTDGHGPTLPWNQVAALYNYLAVISKNKTAATEADVQNMLSDSRYFYQVMLSNIVGQTPTDAVPQRQPVDNEPKQPELFEGDVVPMTKDNTTLQAYNDALAFLKYAYQETADNNLVRSMRQDFASKYKQRFAILPNADGRTYSMVDKQQSKRYNLPLPGFPLEEGAMKALAMSGQGVPAQYTVVKMVGSDIVPIKTHDNQTLAQRHAQNIKKKYPGMQIAVADETGKISMVGITEEPYDGKSDWSDGQGQWSSENNLISSGNNPMGFSESADDIKKKMSKLEALALAANRAGDDAKCKMYQQKVQSLKQKLSKSMTEELGDSPVAGAIVDRIRRQRLDLLKHYGPDLVGAAIDNVADYVGDVDEIGSSDVSAWVMQVERMLKENPPEAFAEDQADQVKKVFKDKAGQPVGEIGIDPESSPGNGEWYVHHYATGYSVVGFDSAAEAKRELLYVNKHPDAVERHPSTKEQGLAEGWSDAVVSRRTGSPRTPYAVYIKGKKWKDFENDDHAEAVANKLKAKFRADGRDPSVITIAPTDYDKGVAEGYNSQFKSKEEAVRGARERVKTFRDHLDGIEIWAMPDGGFDQVHTMNANGRDHCIANGGKKIGTIYPPKLGMSEAETDYSKRRDRERKVDAGRPVKPLPKNPQTDYAKKRAKERRDMELGEGTINYWKKLQQDRFLREHKKAFDLVAELEQSIKEIK